MAAHGRSSRSRPLSRSPRRPTSSSSAPAPAGRPPPHYLAMAGLDVLLLEKTAFPREKVCGDGLTPRAVRELITLGIPTPEEDGWIRNQGLRIIGGGHAPAAALAGPRELPALRPGPHPAWTSTTSWPGTPSKHGARLRERTNVTGPVLDERTGAIVGVTAKPVDDDGRATGAEVTFRAPLVVAADGNSTPAVALDGPAQARRPPDGRGRAHLLHAAPGTTTTTWSRWLELWDAPTTRASESCCPATAGSSASATAPATSASASSTPPRRSARSTTRTCCAAGSRRCPRSGPTTTTTMTGPIRGAALPMGFNRQPHYDRGPAARRRRRRHGQPVQRRGHRLRDGVRPARRRRHRPGLRPARRRRPRAGAAVLPRGS